MATKLKNPKRTKKASRIEYESNDSFYDSSIVRATLPIPNSGFKLTA